MGEVNFESGYGINCLCNFDAKRQANQNLILAIVLCSNFVFEGNSTLVLFTRKEKKLNLLFLLQNNVHREPVHFYTYIEKEFISRNF